MRVLLIPYLIAAALFSQLASANIMSQKTDKGEISKQDAVVLAKKTINGKTLKITEKTNYYTVRILKSDGHVVDLQVNKKTGEVKKE